MKNKKPIILGITGNPGTGKSTISKLLRLAKIPVQEADVVVNALLKQPEVIFQVKEKFPTVLIDNQVNKKKLAEIVFEDQKKLLILEKILHPLVYDEHKRFVKLHHNEKIIALEIPLLYETGRDTICQYVFYTTCEPSIARQRIKKRGWSFRRYKNVLSRLLPDEVKRNKAHFIIDTTASKLRTWHQVRDALKEICNKEASHA